MYGVNRVTLLGNLGNDPETRPLPSGDIVTNFPLATNRRWKDKAGTQQEQTEWHKVVTFGRLAEVAREFLKKGAPVFVEGRLRTSDWDDKEGRRHYKTEVIVENLQLLSSGGRAANDAPRANDPAPREVAAAPPPPRPPRARPGASDDIPF